MSLEQAIQENTAVMKELIAALNNKGASLGEAIVAHVAQADAKPEVKKEKKIEKKPEPAVEAEPVEKEEDTKPIEYADVRNAVMAIAKTDRTKAEAVLQRFGVTQISKLKPEQYADVLEYATKVINDEVDPAAGEGDLE